MILLSINYIIFLFSCLEISGSDLVIETIETTWRFANTICESSNHILMPGRSYRKADLIKSLDVGQTIWMKGWRMVTEKEQNEDGNIRFLKVDFIPNYNVMIRKFVCKYGNGSFDVPATRPTDQSGAEEACLNRKGELAKIGRHDVKHVLDTIGDKTPHWSTIVTSDDSIAKQCLAVKRITSGIKYYYGNCDMNLPFACLQDEKASKVFAPVVSKRYVSFVEFEDEITKILSRTTPPPPVTAADTRDESEFSVVTSTESYVPNPVSTSVLPRFDSTADSVESSSLRPFSAHLSLLDERTSSNLETLSSPPSSDTVLLHASKNLISSRKSEASVVSGTPLVFKETVKDYKSNELASNSKSNSELHILDNSITTSLASVSSSVVSLSGSSSASLIISEGNENTLSQMTRHSESSNTVSTLFPSFIMESVSVTPHYKLKAFDEITDSVVSHLIEQLETSTSLHKQSFFEKDKGPSTTKDYTLNSPMMSGKENYTRTINPSISAKAPFTKYKTDEAYDSELDLSARVKPSATVTSDYLDNTILEKTIRTSTTRQSAIIEKQSESIVRQSVTESVMNDLFEFTSSVSSDLFTPQLQPSFTKVPISHYLPETTTTMREERLFTYKMDESIDDTAFYFSSESVNDYYNIPSETEVHATDEIVSMFNFTTPVLLDSSKSEYTSKPLGDIVNESSSSSSARTTIKFSITPSATVDIVISKELGKFDLEPINRPSKDPQEEAWSQPMWIAVGVIGIATIVAIIIAVVLYNRRKTEKKLSLNEANSNGNHLPLIARKPGWSENEAYVPQMTNENNKRQNKSDQGDNVFPDEAYEL